VPHRCVGLAFRSWSPQRRCRDSSLRWLRRRSCCRSPLGGPRSSGGRSSRLSCGCSERNGAEQTQPLQRRESDAGVLFEGYASIGEIRCCFGMRPPQTCVSQCCVSEDLIAVLSAAVALEYAAGSGESCLRDAGVASGGSATSSRHQLQCDGGLQNVQEQIGDPTHPAKRGSRDALLHCTVEEIASWPERRDECLTAASAWHSVLRRFRGAVGTLPYAGFAKELLPLLSRRAPLILGMFTA
jgi:hypothetical protein